MKHLLLLVLFSLAMLPANAQKQVETKTRVTTQASFENAQARVPDVVVTPKVKPLVCEVEIIKGVEPKDSFLLDGNTIASLDNKVENIYSYGTFLWTKKVKEKYNEECHMIVAPTYHLKQIDDKNNYILEINGFPARFTNWHTATEEDYEWLRISGGYNSYSNGVMNPLIKK